MTDADRSHLDHEPTAEMVAPHKGQGFRRVLPAGTVLLGSLSVVEGVARWFQLTIEELRGTRKEPRFTEARGAGYWLLIRHSRMTTSEIAQAFGKKDHTTVLYGVKRCERRRESDSWFKAHLDELERKLEEQAKGAVA